MVSRRKRRARRNRNLLIGGAVLGAGGIAAAMSGGGGRKGTAVASPARSSLPKAPVPAPRGNSRQNITGNKKAPSPTVPTRKKPARPVLVSPRNKAVRKEIEQLRAGNKAFKKQERKDLRKDTIKKRRRALKDRSGIRYDKLSGVRRNKRAILKEKIIAASGGRKNSRVTPELTRQKVTLPRRKREKRISTNARVNNMDGGFKLQSGRMLSTPKSKALEKLGFTPGVGFEKGTSKRARRKAAKIIKSLGRFSRRDRRLAIFR